MPASSVRSGSSLDIGKGENKSLSSIEEDPKQKEEDTKPVDDFGFIADGPQK